MIDIVREIDAVQREVGSGRLAAGEARTIRLRRTYDAADRRRLGRADEPGADQPLVPARSAATTGSAAATSSRATPAAGSSPANGRTGCPVTWGFAEMGDAAMSELELRLTPDGDEATRLRARAHGDRARRRRGRCSDPAPSAWAGTQGVLGLALHLRGGSVGDPTAWQLSDEGRAFATRSSEAWGAASAAAGADAETVARNVASTNGFYAPEPDAAVLKR